MARSCSAFFSLSASETAIFAQNVVHRFVELRSLAVVGGENEVYTPVLQKLFHACAVVF